MATSTGPNNLPAPAAMAFDEGSYPTLAAHLDGPDGGKLRVEIEHLLGRPLRKRAPRREIKRIVRLHAGTYDEVVLVKDLSASGVRLLLQEDCPLDVRDMIQMELAVGLPDGPRVLPISFVRLCGQEDRKVDIACRFLQEGPELEVLVREIRSHVFGE